VSDLSGGITEKEGKRGAPRDWYVEMDVDHADTWEETIGLFGGKSSPATRYQITRASKMARLREVLAIASRYDIFHGLTPESFRHLLEELGPTFVKAGQILSMRSEILPQSFCEELAKLRTSVEPMHRDLLLETLRGCEVHPSTILGSVDEGIFRALGVQVTNEPVYATKSLYRKK